jgi:protein-disulfide isomerase
MSTLKIPVRPEDHAQGDENAACTLVEYGDYQCPHCGRAYPIIKRVQKHFGNRLRFVFRNFPLNEIHAQAESAAETAEFAGSQGKYWEMHDLLFENQTRFSPMLFEELAQELKLNPTDLRDALAKGEYRAHVHSDFMSGARSGVNGTPTFFINGQRLDGSWDYQDLVEAIEEVLASA